MLQNNYQRFEEYSCDVCSEAVTNPLCPHCITTEIEAWLSLYPNLREKILPGLNRYLKKAENRVHEATMCIKCGNKRASLCPYCFTEHVLEELKRIQAPKFVIKEFLEFFNFDLHHTGYSKEAEKLGVI